MVGFLVVFSMVFSAQGGDADALSAMLGIGTSVIGTLVGAFLGLRQGQQGREAAQERSEALLRETEHVLWSALAQLPPERAEEILSRRFPPN